MRMKIMVGSARAAMQQYYGNTFSLYLHIQFGISDIDTFILKSQTFTPSRYLRYIVEYFIIYCYNFIKYRFLLGLILSTCQEREM